LSAGDRLAGLAKGFVREDRIDSLSGAIEWGLNRGCGEESRAFFEALLSLLAEFNATVLPVEREPPELQRIEMRITLSRRRPGRPAQRLRFVVTHSGGDEETDWHGYHRLRVTVDECVVAPWETAARVVGEILRRASEASGEEPEAEQPKEGDQGVVRVDSG